MKIIPEINTSCLVLIDVQERLAKAMQDIDARIEKQKIMLKAAAEIGFDVIVTEQYPRGLGSTIPELAELLPEQCPVIEKTSFSCCGEPAFMSELDRKKRKSVFIMGIESHVCVLQTVLDLMAEGFTVYVIADTVASRNNYDREIALDLMRQQGAVITTTESLLFMLMRNASHPAFKQVSKLIR